MSFPVGTTVKVGSGRVEYTVFNAPAKEGFTAVQSNNTGKVTEVETSRLKLAESQHASEDAINAAIAAGEVHMSKEWVKEAFTEVRENGLTDAQMEEADETYAESGMHAAQEYVERSKEENIARVAEWAERNDVPFTPVEDQPMAAWEIELLHAPGVPNRPYLLTVDHVTTGHKSYGAACDALIIAKRAGFRHAVIDHDGVRKATRIAA